MNIYIFLKNGSPLFARSRTSAGVRTHEDDLLRAGVFMISLCKISIRLSGTRISGQKPMTSSENFKIIENNTLSIFKT